MSFFFFIYTVHESSCFLFIFGQARTSRNHFVSVEGDHLTYLSVYRELDEFLEERKAEKSEAKVEKIMRKWCKVNFVNSRSLKHARDIYRFVLSSF